MSTYGQLADGTTNWQSFEKAVADKLKMYPFLKWKGSKTLKLAKKLYKKGYTVSDTVSFIILNS